MDRSGWVILCAVAIGSAGGGVARHVLTEAVGRLAAPGFPWGTIVVNVSGSLAIGALAAMTAAGAGVSWSPAWRHAAVTGVLGGFTTFSAFSLQTVSLLQHGQLLAAIANVALSVGLGVAACWVGFAIAVAIAR